MTDTRMVNMSHILGDFRAMLTWWYCAQNYFHSTCRYWLITPCWIDACYVLCCVILLLLHLSEVEKKSRSRFTAIVLYPTEKSLHRDIVLIYVVNSWLNVLLTTTPTSAKGHDQMNFWSYRPNCAHLVKTLKSAF